MLCGQGINFHTFDNLWALRWGSTNSTREWACLPSPLPSDTNCSVSCVWILRFRFLSTAFFSPRLVFPVVWSDHVYFYDDWLHDKRLCLYPCDWTCCWKCESQDLSIFVVCVCVWWGVSYRPAAASTATCPSRLQNSSGFLPTSSRLFATWSMASRFDPPYCTGWLLKFNLVMRPL